MFFQRLYVDNWYSKSRQPCMRKSWVLCGLHPLSIWGKKINKKEKKEEERSEQAEHPEHARVARSRKARRIKIEWIFRTSSRCRRMVEERGFPLLLCSCKREAEHDGSQRWCDSLYRYRNHVRNLEVGGLLELFLTSSFLSMWKW